MHSRLSSHPVCHSVCCACRQQIRRLPVAYGTAPNPASVFYRHPYVSTKSAANRLPTRGLTSRPLMRLSDRRRFRCLPVSERSSPQTSGLFFSRFCQYPESYVYFILLSLLHTPFVLCRQCFPIPHNRADKSAWKPDFFFLIQKTLWRCMRRAILFFTVYLRQNGNIQPVH